MSAASRTVSIDTDSFLASSDEDSSKQKKKSSIGLKDLFKKTSPSKGEKRRQDSDSDVDASPKKKKEMDPNRTYFTAKGSVNVVGEFNDGPVCFKCDQVCKDKSQLKNHVLSHFYEEFYKILPSSKPYPCPECEHENRDRITLVRHYAFTHRHIFEYVTEDQLGMNATAPRRANKPKEKREPKEQKEPKYKNYLESMKSLGSSSDEDISKKRHDGPLINPKSHDKPGEHKKHKEHKEHKHDRDSKEHKEHKKHKKDKKEKRDKDRHERKSTDVKSPLSHMLKEMTPSSDNSQSKVV